jgi:UDP-glucose 4-epimerase
MGRLALVAGAYGFIGRHVCRALAEQGIAVRALGHGAWSAADAADWGVSRWLDADITFDSLAALTRGETLDAVIHCAGSGSVSYSYGAPFDDFQRSVSSVATLLEFVRGARIGKPRIVITSSAAVYGDQGDVDLGESSVCSPISPYGFNKRAAEDLCRSYSTFFGLEISIVRLFSVYGNGLRKQLLWDAVNKFSSGNPAFFGTGRELRDWIHVEDAAALLCSAAQAAQGSLEIYNGGHDKATTCEVLALLSQYFEGAPQPIFTGEVHTGNPQRMTADSGYARQQLGWQAQVPLAAGLRRYVDWFKSAQQP